MSASEKLKKWVEENPDGYLEMSFRKIAGEVGISHSTVKKNLLKIIADRDSITLSQVRFKRQQAGFTFTAAGDMLLSDDQIKKIWELWNQKYDCEEIAYIVGVDERTVAKYLSGETQK